MIEFFVMAFFAASQSGRPAPDGGTQAISSAEVKHPIDIKSEQLQIQEKTRIAIWSGHVKAKRDTTDLTCDRLVAHYTKDQEVTRIECIGNVQVWDGNKWARGERADFDNRTGILEVTGSPEAKEGNNHVRGTKVIFYKEKDTIHVENATTIFDNPPKEPPPPKNASQSESKKRTKPSQ
jgi:lipopolysaccharide export system protein LptA